MFLMSVLVLGCQLLHLLVLMPPSALSSAAHPLPEDDDELLDALASNREVVGGRPLRLFSGGGASFSRRPGGRLPRLDMAGWGCVELLGLLLLLRTTGTPCTTTLHYIDCSFVVHSVVLLAFVCK